MGSGFEAARFAGGRRAGGIDLRIPGGAGQIEKIRITGSCLHDRGCATFNHRRRQVAQKGCLARITTGRAFCETFCICLPRQ